MAPYYGKGKHARSSHVVTNASARAGIGNGSGSGSVNNSSPPRPSARTHDRGRETQRIRKKEQARHELTPARGYRPPNVQRRQAVGADGPGGNGTQSNNVRGQTERSAHQQHGLVNGNRSYSAPQLTPATFTIQTPPPSPTRWPSVHAVRDATRREPIGMSNNPNALKGARRAAAVEAGIIPVAVTEDVEMVNTPSPATMTATTATLEKRGADKPKAKQKQPRKKYKGNDPVKRAFSNTRLQNLISGRSTRPWKDPDRLFLRECEKRMFR
jgi:hypothetical protein